LIFAAKVAS